MLENLYNEISEGIEEFKEEKAEKEKEIKSMKGSGQYTEEFIKDKAAELEEKAEEKLNSKVAAAFNNFEKKAENKIENLQKKLKSEVDYSEKTYKSTKAANIINMLEPKQVPNYINQISDKVEREEYTRLAMVKLSDQPKLQRQLNDNLLNSLGQEELEARKELAYNRQLLQSADNFLNKTSKMLDKITTNQNQQNYYIQEQAENLSHYLGNKNEKIKESLSIINQF